MKQRKRMLTTLLTLVVAMTATTWLLSRLDGRVRRLGPAGTAEAVVRVAQTAVGEQTSPRNGWTYVDVLAASAATNADRALTATSGRPDHHFRIDADGRVHATVAWRNQHELSGAAGSIIIQCVPTAQDRTTITPAQWLAVQAIAATISDRITPQTGRTLPIRLDTRLSAATP